MRNQLKGVIKVLEGVFFTKKGKPVTSFRQALREEAKCGCGIDCCKGALVLIDQDTQEPAYIYVKGGVVLVTDDPKNPDLPQ